MTLLIYIIGCIVTYICFKIYRYYTNSNDWINITLTIVASCLSFTGLITLLLIIITEHTDKLPKPPKWL